MRSYGFDVLDYYLLQPQSLNLFDEKLITCVYCNLYLHKTDIFCRIFSVYLTILFRTSYQSLSIGSIHRKLSCWFGTETNF